MLKCFIYNIRQGDMAMCWFLLLGFHAMPLVIPTQKLFPCEYPVSLRNKSDNLNTVSY